MIEFVHIQSSASKEKQLPSGLYEGHAYSVTGLVKVDTISLFLKTIYLDAYNISNMTIRQ